VTPPRARPGNLNRQALVNRLNRAVEALDDMATHVAEMAVDQGIEPMRMQWASGEPALVAIVTAQANALAALAALELLP
jgi:hypothetical protein